MLALIMAVGLLLLDIYGAALSILTERSPLVLSPLGFFFCFVFFSFSKISLRLVSGRQRV